MSLDELKQAIIELDSAQTKINEADCVFSRRSSAYNFYDVCRQRLPILLEAAKNFVKEHDEQPTEIGTTSTKSL